MADRLSHMQDAQRRGDRARCEGSCWVLRHYIEEPGMWSPGWIEAYAIGWCFGAFEAMPLGAEAALRDALCAPLPLGRPGRSSGSDRTPSP